MIQKLLNLDREQAVKTFKRLKQLDNLILEKFKINLKKSCDFYFYYEKNLPENYMQVTIYEVGNCFPTFNEL